MNESKENNESVMDDFQLRVREILDEIKPPDAHKIIIMNHFKQLEIRSTHVTLKRLNNDLKEKCKKAMSEISIGTLVKLFNKLNSEYGIIKGECTKNDNHQIFDAKSLVFISKTCTQDIVNDKLIDESELKQTEDTEKAERGGRLFQLLKWTIRLNQIHKNISCYTSENGIDFLLINSELSDKNGDELYMFCIKNDISTKKEKWQLVKLITATEIEQSVGDVQLPQGLRQHVAIEKFKHFKQNWSESKIVLSDYKEYLQLKMIKTKSEKHKKGVLEIYDSEFISYIERAISSKHEMIPIISMIIGNKCKVFGVNYSIDLLLPVNIKNEWVGICYRYDDDQKRWIPFQVLFDQYDIINKAILYSPKFDANKLSFFKNTICKIVLKTEKSKSKPSKSNQPRQGPSKENNDDTDAYSSFQPPPYHQEPSQENRSSDNKVGKAYHYPNVANSNESKESCDDNLANPAQVPSNSLNDEGHIAHSTNTNPIHDNLISTTNNTMTSQEANSLHTQYQNISTTAPGYHIYVASNQQSPFTTQDTSHGGVLCLGLPLPPLPSCLPPAPPEVQIYMIMLHYQLQQYPLSTFCTNASINLIQNLSQNQSTNNYYNSQFITQAPTQTLPLQSPIQKQSRAINN